MNKLAELHTSTAKLVLLYLIHYGPARSQTEIENALNISHKAMWQAKRELLAQGFWQETERNITSIAPKIEPPTH